MSWCSFEIQSELPLSLIFYDHHQVWHSSYLKHQHPFHRHQAPSSQNALSLCLYSLVPLTERLHFTLERWSSFYHQHSYTRTRLVQGSPCLVGYYLSSCLAQIPSSKSCLKQSQSTATSTLCCPLLDCKEQDLPCLALIHYKQFKEPF